MARCCFVCCVRHHRIHPLENILDISQSPGDEESDSLGLDEHSNLGDKSAGLQVTTVKRKDDFGQGLDSGILTQMESQTGLEAASHRDQTVITALHAAAVNGDKSSLTKLLASTHLDLDAGDKFGRTPLMYCILGDRLECAEILIKSGTDVNRRDIGGRTALHWAAHKGNFKCMKLLLSKGANWKAKDNEGQSPMHLATRHKSTKCLSLVMKQLEPGEVDDQDKNKRTALHWASSYGNLEHVKMLIKQDSNIGIPDVEGKTPLHWAASSKDEESVMCVRLILETAPSVINWQDYEGRTALHLAVADGNTDVVNALRSLEKCNVSAMDNMFRTPLHWSAVLGHSEISAMLLDSGVDFLSSDSNGATPLHYASQNNYADTVEVFLEHKGMRDEPDIEGRTAFMWAAGKGADSVVRTFIEHKVDMTLTDKNGGTALHAAALSGHPSTVKLLLQHDAAIDFTDGQKHSPLFRACEMGHTEVAQTLIDHGARVDVTDLDGRTPLHWAALGGHAYICQMLIHYGLDPNVRDNSGRTPLQCAAYGGYVNCMSVLIEHKADPNTQDKEGMTCLHWACSKGHSDAVRLLIEFQAFPNHMEFTEDRYTPLDYALMGEHYEVAQYMIWQGALSITGIQDIAAVKIQAVFRGFRVRKAFLDRKMLLMKHEQLRKNAAKKKAEESKSKQDKSDPECNQDHTPCSCDTPGDGVPCQKTDPETKDAEGKRDAENQSTNVLDRNSEETKNHVPEKPQTESPAGVSQKVEAATTKEGPKRGKQQILRQERQRVKLARRREWAVSVIQAAWRRYQKRKVYKAQRDSIREKRLQSSEDEWSQQMAALTIQLAWRKYYRRKLLGSRTAKNQWTLETWTPESVASKKVAMVQHATGVKSSLQTGHRKTKLSNHHTPGKPDPSPATRSYNFALDQYFPHNEAGKEMRNSWKSLDSSMSSEEFGKLKLTDSNPAKHFSYNLKRH